MMLRSVADVLVDDGACDPSRMDFWPHQNSGRAHADADAGVEILDVRAVAGAPPLSSHPIFHIPQLPRAWETTTDQQQHSTHDSAFTWT